MKVKEGLGIVVLIMILVSGFKISANSDLQEKEIVDRDLSERQLNRLMRNVSENYQNNIISDPFAARGLFMEKARCEGKWCMFAEGEAILKSYGYDAPIEVHNFGFIPIRYYKSDRTDGWTNRMGSYEATFPDYDFFSDTGGAHVSLLSGFRFFEINGPLSQPRRSAFSLSETIKQPADSDLLSVDFETDSRRGPQYKGSMVICGADQRIHHIVMERIPFHSPIFFRWLPARAEIIFSHINNETYVSQITFWQNFEGVELTVIAKIEEPVRNPADFTEEEYFVFQNHTLNPWIPKIYELETFDSQFLNDLSYLRADLEQDITLEQQFIANSGQPWHYWLDRDGKKHLGHAGQRIFASIKELRYELELMLE